MNGTQEISFGSDPNQVSHAFRHTDELGLDRTEVIDAIKRDLRSRLPLSVSPREPVLVGTVVVGGVELHYHAYPVNEGLVNVGRITGV